jgi:hypothetical protein
MSSPTFDLTFSRAVRLIEASHREREISVILDDFRKRATTSDRNPLSNRNLIVDNRVDSQMLNVPEHLYEVVVRELRKFQLLHVWVRARCPNTDEIIVETRKESKFRRMLNEPCPHCGQDHSAMGYEHIEYFFAINFKLSADKLGLFELSAPGPRPPGPAQETYWFLRRAWRYLSALFQKRDDSPVVATAAALAENRPAKLAPTSQSLLWQLWWTSAIWWSVTLVLFFGLGQVGQAVIAWTVGGVSLCVYAFLAYVTWRIICYRYPIQTRLLTATQLVGGLALSKGALGISLGMEAKDGLATSQFVRFGETDQTFVWAGVAIIAVGFVCVAVMQRFDKSTDP